MAKQQTLTFIVPDGADDPADIIQDALLQADYGIVDDGAIVDPDKMTSCGDVIVIIEEE